MDERLLLEQRVEAKAAMVRLFRFRARRGVGLHYGLSSAFLFAIAVLDVLSVPKYVIIGVAAVWLSVWYLARAAGIKGFERMHNSLDLVEGGEARIRPRLRWYENPAYLWLLLPWYKDPAYLWLLLPIVWATGFVIAGLEGLSLLSVALLAVFIGQLALVRFSTLSGRTDSFLEPHSEDWVIPVALVVFLGMVILNHSALGAGLAAACCLFSGSKSLRDAPKELTRVSS